MDSHSLLQGIFLTRDQTQISCIAGRFFTVWATKEAPFIGRNKNHSKVKYIGKCTIIWKWCHKPSVCKKYNIVKHSENKNRIKWSMFVRKKKEKDIPWKHRTKENWLYNSITKYHTLSCVKQNKFILSQCLWSPNMDYLNPALRYLISWNKSAF